MNCKIIAASESDEGLVSLLNGMPAPNAERQHPEAWPSSTYGHLRGVSFKIVPANKVLSAGTAPANNLLVILK